MEIHVFIICILGILGWIMFIVAEYFYRRMLGHFLGAIEGWKKSNELCDEVIKEGESMRLMLKLMDEKEKQTDNISDTAETVGGV